MVHVSRGQAQGHSDIGNHLGIEYYIFFLQKIVNSTKASIKSIKRDLNLSKYMYTHKEKVVRHANDAMHSKTK